MTKKHYELLATAIAIAASEVKSAEERHGVECVLEYISYALKIDNPRFDEKRFVQFIEKHIR